MYLYMWASIKDFYIDFKSYIVRLESINFFMFFLIFIFSFLTIESFNKIFLKEISIYYYYGILLGIYFFYVYWAYFLRRFLYSNKNVLIFNYKDFSLSQLVKSDIKKLESQLWKKSDNLLIGKYFYSFTDLDLKLYLFRYNIETILYIYYDEEKNHLL